ncbi:hypothetical protein [Melittangium boletus]|uniref:Uncharacterized protein n=1 Tax=Melittangium boletus DSM 14713 TaxID=1294270 RepID=A0A250IAK1_9BACT|nr:hypothetical protein [Melittangium boletus]ATB28230.1 hypothetical protein MEBOL_001676 [Melittangium boletus DSM 14713]
MTTKVEKKFPRSKVIERQNERAREVLELDENSLESVRGGGAKYGLPPPPPDEIFKPKF